MTVDFDEARVSLQIAQEAMDSQDYKTAFKMLVKSLASEFNAPDDGISILFHILAEIRELKEAANYDNPS